MFRNVKDRKPGRNLAERRAEGPEPGRFPAMDQRAWRALQRVCRAAMCVVAAALLVCSMVPVAALGRTSDGGAVLSGDGATLSAMAEAAAAGDGSKGADEAKSKDKDKDEKSSSSSSEKSEPSSSSSSKADDDDDDDGKDDGKDEESSSSSSEQEEVSSSSSSSEPTPPAAPKRTLEDMDLYVTTTNSYGEWGTELDRVNKGTADAPEFWLKDGIKEKGGQVKLLVYAYWSGGRACRQDDGDSWISVDLEYRSSDPRIATVSNNGVVTASSDGEVEISVTDRESGVSASIRINVSGQAGALASELWVCDATGRQYEEERVVYDTFDNPLALYVREVFTDGTTASNAPQAADYAPDKMTEVTWSVNNDMAKISAAEGTLTATKEAREAATTSITVTAQATGGDPDVNGGVVRTHAYVLIKGSGVPTVTRLAADSLTVHVVYDEYPDNVVATKQWSLDELKALETANSTYTLTRSNGGYVTASATGIHLTTLIDQMELETGQVKSFTFTANDGVNPGKMTYSFLFGERYWWPNYEFGQNRTDATLVFPMLAWESDWRESSSGATNCDADYSNLNDNSRLRLLFGSETNSDNKTDHSLKYISEMTIRIEGAPDVTDGEGEKGDGDKGDDSGGDDDKSGGEGDNGDDPAGDDGNNEGDGDDGGQENPDESGATAPGGDDEYSGNPDNNDESADGPSNDGKDSDPDGKDERTSDNDGKNDKDADSDDKVGEGGQGNSDGSEEPDPGANDNPPDEKGEGDSGTADSKGDAGATQAAQTPKGQERDNDVKTDLPQPQSSTQLSRDALARAVRVELAREDVGDGAGSSSESASERWRVYQMLNPFDKTDYQIEELNDNPLGPYVGPLVVLLLLLGGIERWLNFKRETTPWPKARAV